MRITPPMVLCALSLASLATIYRGCSHADVSERVASARRIFKIAHGPIAEKAYMDACKECASAAECERDRLVIVSGMATDNYSPCE